MNILLLGFVSFLNDISSEIIQPILPLFIAQLGGGSMAVGLIGGVSDGLPSILKLLSGCYTDRLGRRKPLVVAGYALSAAGKIFLPFSSAWQHVFLLKTVERSGKGVRSAPRDAMISESADEKNKGRGFGLHRAMDSAGAVVGSLLAYLLWQGGYSYSSILMLAGILSIVALIPFIKVKESFSGSECSIRLNLSALSPELKAFLFIACLFALGNFSYMFFILRAQAHFTGSMAVAAPILLYLLQSGLCPPGHASGDMVGSGGEKKGPLPGVLPFCPYRHRICFYLQPLGPDRPLRPLRPGICPGGRLGEGLYLRPLPSRAERKLFRDILRFGGGGIHHLQPARWGPVVPLGC